MVSVDVVGDLNYYKALTESADRSQSYFLSDRSGTGVWDGQGAQKLGLTGRVTAETFGPTLQGFHPFDGSPLVQNAGKSDRRMGFDLTFSVSKSLSVLWALSDPETRQRIERIGLDAVRTTLAYFEETFAKTRRGKGGHALQDAGIAVAIFQHSTSRANEPNLHYHAVLANVGVRADGTTGTLLTTGLFALKMTLGALFRAEMATQLSAQMGLPLRQVREWFEIDGVPEELCAALSSRSKEIQRSAGEGASAHAKEVAALATRRAKQEVAPTALAETWNKVGLRHGFGPEEAGRLVARSSHAMRPQSADPAFALERALVRLTDKQSHFAETDLVRAFAEETQTAGLGLRGITNAVRNAIQADQRIVAIGEQHGINRYTTREMLALERQILADVARSRDDASHLVQPVVVEEVIHRNTGLNREQRDALRALTAEKGSVQAVVGFAGTGKTTLIDACREAWQKEGLTVRGAALSGKAAQGLQEKARIVSDTLHRTLQEIDQGRWAITPKTVLVVDEASMVGTRQMARLVTAVERGGGKLVLVGDPKQLQAIEAGGPFQSVVRRYGAAQLSDIRRQRAPWARKAVRQFADGKAAEALRAFAERGLITVTPTRFKAMEALIDSWKTRPEPELPDTLILASTRAEAASLNRAAQAVRRERGVLGAESLAIDKDLFHVGDRVLLTRNSRLYGVQNGALGSVVGLAQRRMTVLLDSGRRVTLDVDHYPHLKLGYAVTTHKGQGVTVKYAYVLTGGAMQDLHLAYVQASRARDETRLFVNRAEAGKDLKDLVKSMTRLREKNLAADVQDAVNRQGDPTPREAREVADPAPRPTRPHMPERRR